MGCIALNSVGLGALGLVGLETFAFMRTPATHFGNIVWVRGGDRPQEAGGDRRGKGGLRSWWRAWKDSSRLMGGPARGRLGSELSQLSLTPGRAGNASQMEIVTSVVVEGGDEAGMETRSSRPGSMSTSVNSTVVEYNHRA